MDKEFIPYEQALELKELGFDEKCMKYYRNGHPEGYYLHYFDVYLSNSHRIFDKDDLMCAAPLYQQVFRWFRDYHNWIGGVRSLGSYNENMIIADFKKDEQNSFIIRGESYQDAEFKALKYLIERIKNI